jgi:hypothetical protein
MDGAGSGAVVGVVVGVLVVVLVVVVEVDVDVGVDEPDPASVVEVVDPVVATSSPSVAARTTR